MRRPNDRPSGDPSDPVTPDLIERCRSGDEGAWRELVEATHRDVYTLCLRILRDPNDAAEATQDAYLKAWRGLHGFRGDSLFTTWLYRVATNAAISKGRGRKRRRTHETDDDEMLANVASSSSTEGSAGDRLEIASVERAMLQLSDVYRSAVVLRDVYGMSIEEVAERLDISQTAAKVRVHRGRKKLKELLYPEGGDE